MVRVFFVAGVWLLVVLAVSGSPMPTLAAQGGLPDAPGRDMMMKLCSNCHAADVVASVRFPPQGWRDVIARMVAAGAKGTDQELETVFEYVSTQFPVDAQPALDLNTATAVELESVAGLLRKESAALIAYREKNGRCKKIEDLKKVTGLDYRKIEARKEHLACQ